MPFPTIFANKKKAPQSNKLKETGKDETTESSRSCWSDVEYGPGWEKVFDPSPANLTEMQMKHT